MIRSVKHISPVSRITVTGVLCRLPEPPYALVEGPRHVCSD